MNSMKNGRSFRFDPLGHEGKDKCKAEPEEKDMAWFDEKDDAHIMKTDSSDCAEDGKYDTNAGCTEMMYDHEISITGVKSYSQSSSLISVELEGDAIVYVDGGRIDWRGFQTSFEGEVLVSLLGNGIDAEVVMNFDKTYVTGGRPAQTQTMQTLAGDFDGDSWSLSSPSLAYYTARNVGKSMPLGDELIQALTKSITEYEDQQWNGLYKEVLGEVKAKAAEPVQLELPLHVEYVPGKYVADVYNNEVKLTQNLDYEVTDSTTISFPPAQTQAIEGFTPSIVSSLNPAFIGQIGNINTEAVRTQTNADLISTAFINNEMPKIDWSSLTESIKNFMPSSQSVLLSKHETGVSTYGYAGLVNNVGI